MTLLLLALACSTNDGTDAEETSFPPPAPENGVQIAIGDISLDGYSETEMCRYIKTDNLAEGRITSMELVATEGLHHALVMKSSADLDDGEVACFGIPEELMSGLSIPEPLLVTSTQVNEESLSFPEGVAVPIDASQQLVFNYHYLNVNEEPLDAEIYLNLTFAEEDEETEDAGVYIMGNISGVDIPAGTTQTLSTTCSFDEDVSMFSITPHMHQYGTAFSMFLTESGEVLHQDDDWYDPATTYMDPPQEISADEDITFTCSWENSTDQDVTFGETTEDEMCFVFGFHWPASGFTYMQEGYGCQQEE
ncbi:MAG: hypothetical protein QGG40_09115 [Myxococcota bacterium]|jgi:hypothetical protein|nr:hypothetical protein [Myxococcota bacterium]